MKVRMKVWITERLRLGLRTWSGPCPPINPLLFRHSVMMDSCFFFASNQMIWFQISTSSSASHLLLGSFYTSSPWPGATPAHLLLPHPLPSVPRSVPVWLQPRHMLFVTSLILNNSPYSWEKDKCVLGARRLMYLFSRALAIQQVGWQQ